MGDGDGDGAGADDDGDGGDHFCIDDPDGDETSARAR